MNTEAELISAPFQHFRRSIFSMYDEPVATRMWQSFTEYVTLVMNDDLASVGSEIDSTLVETGLPIELSVSLCRTEPVPTLRFAAEPCAYLPVLKRQALAQRRIAELLTHLEQNEHTKLFEDIYLRLSAQTNQARASVGWLFHVSLMVERPPACRVYFAPVPAHDPATCKPMLKGRAFVDTVFDRVISVFELCGMDDHIPLLRKMYDLAVNEEGSVPAENFITFLGADFRKGEPVGLKVYFNPQALRKAERNGFG